MKRIVITLVSGFILCSVSIAQLTNEVSLLIAPLKLDEQSSYQLMYRKELSGSDWSLRGGLRLLVDTDRETRADTLFTNEGTVQYDLSIGAQRKLPLDGLDKAFGYVALDGYWNSSFDQAANSDYYGYFWNLGVRPTFGVAYEPIKNIRLSLESRANFNVNLQDYNAPSNNANQRFTFNPVDHLAIGLGYLF
ncbi:hypothetical protein N9811_05965 [Bacteroidia bacterium]|jgi:hypothetical protein|nr:hypothetical protein [Bacteroidota bacterium]MDA8930178.1 hypothetical protein [Bacteroidia bacterium]MDB4174328.1 hypothetical protein [Bacteroidia bacterium]